MVRLFPFVAIFFPISLVTSLNEGSYSPVGCCVCFVFINYGCDKKDEIIEEIVVKSAVSGTAISFNDFADDYIYKKIDKKE